MIHLHRIGTHLSLKAKAFVRNRDGNISLLFGLALVPLVGAVGVGVDYSRASQARSQLQAAADSAALAIARHASAMSDAQLRSEAERHFRAVMNSRPDLQTLPLTVTRNGQRVQIVAAGVLPTTFSKVLGFNQLDVATRVEAGFGDRKVELVLALDNTGSMNDRGSPGGPRKIDELKRATRNLITAAEAAAPAGSGIVKIGIVPFETQVRIDPSTYGTRPWLAFSPGGPGFADIAGQMRTPTQWAAHGCLSDRGPGFDTNDRPTEPSRPESFYPAVTCASSTQQRIQPLTDNWGTLRTLVDGMQPGGYTNVTIGARFGMAALNPGDVLGSSAAPLGDRNTDKYLIILTDGDNTENRFGRVGSGNTAAAIDAKTLAMCNDIKAKPARPGGQPAVTIYTVRLLAGNATMLRACASDPSKYKDVNDATQLNAVFQDIIKEITALKLTM